MATLTSPIAPQNIVDRFADYVVAAANYGISWGTDVYPFAEFDGNYFGGTTTGKSIGINGASVAVTGNTIAAQQIYDTLIAETYAYTNIRNLRALLYVDGGGGNTGSRPTPGYVYDGTAVAYMNSGYLQTVSADRTGVNSGDAVTSTGLESMFDSMRSNYNGARSNTVTVQINVCHASCHSSCHSSRGRR